MAGSNDDEEQQRQQHHASNESMTVDELPSRSCPADADADGGRRCCSPMPPSAPPPQAPSGPARSRAGAGSGSASGVPIPGLGVEHQLSVRSLCGGDAPSVTSHDGDNASMQSMQSSSTGFLQVVDLGKRHDKMLIRGRESHTSDLDEFDRYVARLRMLERRKVGNSGPVGLGMGVGGGDHGVDHGEHRHSEGGEEGKDGTVEPGKCAEEAVDADDAEETDSDEDDDDDEGRGICEEFWTFVRSILEKAVSVGFEELPDPEGVVPKGKSDADKFLMKCVSIGIINPIHPAVLAKESGIPHEVVMEELLYATKVGLVSMRWAPECERCGSVVTESEQIGRLPARADCDGCHYPNNINTMDKIKVLFNLTQDVLYVLMNNYACQPSSTSMGENALFAAVPATSTGSGFRYSVGCGKDELRPAFAPGKYRMHCPVSKTDNYLTVKRAASDNDRPIKFKMKISDIVCDGTPGNTEREELTVPHGKVHFDIIPDTHSFFVLWVQNDVDDDTLMRLPDEERAPYTSATEMIHHDAFQRLFADQVVSSRPEALLKIKRVVLVFTDVVGSTNLYASLGDGPALQLVRKHYVVLFSAFTRRGRVVKTVGDAVMASFSSGRHAVEACAEALRKVPRECVLPDGSPLEIRIGVHCGSAVVVPLNGVNDYFGQTVNISARVEAAAKASECFVTEAVLGSDPDARSAYYEVLAGRNPSCRKAGTFESTPETELNLKGVAEPVLARGFRLRRRQRRPSDLGGSPGNKGPVRHYRRSDLFERDSFDTAQFDGDLSVGSELGSESSAGKTDWKVTKGGNSSDKNSGAGAGPAAGPAPPKGVKGVSTRPAARAKRRSSVTKVDEAEENEIKEMLDRMPSALSSEGDK